MDSPYTWALLAMALIAMAFSYHLRHAWRWIGLCVACLIVTTIFLDYSDHPEFHPFLCFSLDAGIAAAVLLHDGEDWEFGIAIAFIASAFASLLRMFGFVPDGILYASILEVCNVVAFLCIGGTGIVDMVGKRAGSSLGPMRARLHSPRSAL